MTDAAAFSVTTENKRIQRMACWCSLLKKTQTTPTGHFYPLQCLKEAVR